MQKPPVHDRHDTRPIILEMDVISRLMAKRDPDTVMSCIRQMLAASKITLDEARLLSVQFCYGAAV